MCKCALKSKKGHQFAPEQIHKVLNKVQTYFTSLNKFGQIQTSLDKFKHVEIIKLFLTASAANAVQGLTKSSTNNIPPFLKFYLLLHI